MQESLPNLPPGQLFLHENGGTLDSEPQLLKGSKGDNLSAGLERQNPLFKLDVL